MAHFSNSKVNKILANNFFYSSLQNLLLYIKKVWFFNQKQLYQKEFYILGLVISEVCYKWKYLQKNFPEFNIIQNSNVTMYAMQLMQLNPSKSYWTYMS